MRYGKIARACTYIKNIFRPCFAWTKTCLTRSPKATNNKVQPMSKLDRQFWDILHKRKEK